MAVPASASRPRSSRAARGPLVVIGALALGLGLVSAPAPVAAAAPAPSVDHVVLDAVPLAVTGAAPFGALVAARPGDAAQVATAQRLHPYRELSITAIPDGTAAPTEALPPARPGDATAIAAALRTLRRRAGAAVVAAPPVHLFGSAVSGTASPVRLHVDGGAAHAGTVMEWVTETQSRTWIVRLTSERAGGGVDLGSAAAGLAVTADGVGGSTTLGAAAAPAVTAAPAPAAQPASLPGTFVPTPSWWNGDCDTNHYSAAGGGIAAYRLGAVFQGLVACGPRPYYGEGPDVLANFYAGSWGVLEWECVELSMRWLYQEYGIAPYPANGSQVVWNYGGTRLQRIANGTAGAAPVPGDVLSYGSTSTAGHTSVVTDANIDASGNGTVSVIEENASAGGSSTLSVSGWQVLSSMGVTGWLHDRTGRAIDPLAHAVVGARGGDSALWVRRPDIGWLSYGGRLLAAPAVANISGHHLYVAVGIDQHVWQRTDTTGWSQFSPGAVCNDNPGVLVTGTTGTVACQGSDRQMWVISATVTADGTLLATSGWSPFGGLFRSGPTLTTVAGQTAYFGVGLNSTLWTRTATRSWTDTGWRCVGHAGFAAGATATYFGCHGTDGALWVAAFSGGRWSAAHSVGGALSDGVGAAVNSRGASFASEGTDTHVWSIAVSTTTQPRTPWSGAGGVVSNGAAAAVW